MLEPPRFVLPGRWGKVDLTSAATIKRSTSSFLAEVSGRRDDATLARDVLRRELQPAIDAARSAQAVALHLSIELSPGVALPLALAVSLPRLDDRGFGDAELGPIETFLKRNLDRPDNAAQVGRASSSEICVVRRIDRRALRPPGLERDIDLLQVDYWVAAKDPDRLALLSFTTPLADMEHQILELVDAIIGTVRWDVQSA